MTTQATAAAEKVSGVAGQLVERLRQYEEARDPRAVFAYTYYRLTSSLAAGLRTDTPSFTEPHWVADLSVCLASGYFRAMDAIDAWLDARPRRNRRVEPADLPDSVPPPWRDAYAASTVPHSYVLEDALFPMMAHMSYDLPLALQSLDARWGNHQRVADFHRMNDVLGSCIDGIQDELADRYCHSLSSLDRLFARNDELFTNYGIRVARGLAWFNCDRLLDPGSAERAMESISRSTRAFISEIRSPDDWRLRFVYRLMRLLIPARRQWPAPGTPVD